MRYRGHGKDPTKLKPPSLTVLEGHNQRHAEQECYVPRSDCGYLSGRML